MTLTRNFLSVLIWLSLGFGTVYWWLSDFPRLHGGPHPYLGMIPGLALATAFLGQSFQFFLRKRRNSGSGAHERNRIFETWWSLAQTGEAASRVAHHLNNTLAFISAQIWKIKRLSSREVGEGPIQKSLSEIEKSIEEESEIIRSLSFMSSESARNKRGVVFKPEIRDMPMSEWMERVLRIARLRLKDHSVILRPSEIPEGMIREADPGLRPAFLGLVNLAVDRVREEKSRGGEGVLELRASSKQNVLTVELLYRTASSSHPSIADSEERMMLPWARRRFAECGGAVSEINSGFCGGLRVEFPFVAAPATIVI